jgi:hypothetical protein
MHHLFKQPITWMVLGEIVIVAALAAVSWHVVAGAGGAAEPPLVLPPAASPGDAVPAQEPPGVLSPPTPTARPLLPGLNLDTAFWRQRLSALNAAEAQVEALEWRIVHSAMDSIQRYFESVVVPSIERAERSGR